MTERIRTSHEPAKWRQRIISGVTVDAQSGCWVWSRSRDKWGYGRFIVIYPNGKRRHTGAHRAAWLAFKGDIAGDLVVDHLCRNRACCNPDHMELVTNQENTLRGDHSAKKGRSGRRSECTHGRSDGYMSMSGKYSRWVCRPCRRERVRRWKARRAV